MQFGRKAVRRGVRNETREGSRGVMGLGGEVSTFGFITCAVQDASRVSMAHLQVVTNRLEFGGSAFSQKLKDPPLKRGHSKWLLVWFLRYDDIY